MKFTKTREEETAHKACALYTMYAVVVVVMRRRGLTGRRMEVEGWGDGIIDMKSMQIHCPHENARAAFSDFSTRKLGFKKVRFQALHLQDPCGQSAKTIQNIYVYTQKRFHVDGP